MKHIIKRSNTDYVINCDSQGNGGYNVVPKQIDPYNLYTIEQVEAYLLEHPEALLDMTIIEQERKIAEIKSRRDSKIQSVIWRIERHESELRQGITITEPIEPIDTYIQALRDIPQQAGFPNNIIWPELEGA